MYGEDSPLGAGVVEEGEGDGDVEEMDDDEGEDELDLEYEFDDEDEDGADYDLSWRKFCNSLQVVNLWQCKSGWLVSENY